MGLKSQFDKINDLLRTFDQPTIPLHIKYMVPNPSCFAIHMHWLSYWVNLTCHLEQIMQSE
jgi:hypothetical protein